MVRRRQPREEDSEVNELRERVINEAPEPGSNSLRDDLEELRVPEERLKYVAAKKFSDLPISRATLAGLAKGKWQRMTDIQRAAIPHALAGRDVLGAAKTGSGKTLAFLVPVLERLFREKWSRLDGMGALVVSPTRELALQIFDVLRVLGHQHDLSAGLVIGGKDKAEEGNRISRMNVLVCTPGRLLQHLDETAGFECSSMQILVLDEADRILDLGFKATLTAIVDALPRSRQSLLFSATQTRDVRALANLSLRQPQYIGVHEHSAHATPVKLMHHYMVVKPEQKLDVTWSFVKSHLLAKTIIFLSSCKQVQFMHGVFSALRPGVPLLCLHGRQKQMKRLAVYTEFCSKKHAVLISTDVAARGLDFPAVQWVLQADCPEDVACYIHRTGRTARHTAGGRALLLLTESEKAMLPLLETARIQLHKLTPNASRVFPLRAKLQALLSQRAELKHTAQRAFVSYVRSIHLQANKEVFDARSLNLEELATSMGLLSAPRVRFLSRGADGKNWSGRPQEGESGSHESGSDEGASDDNETTNHTSDLTDSIQDADEDESDDALLSKGKKRKTQPRNKLMRLLTRNTADRRDSAGTSQPAGEDAAPIVSRVKDRADDILHVKRRILPDDELPLGGEKVVEREADDAATRKPKKIKIRKGGTVEGATRTVFDEYGEPLQERFQGGFEKLVDEKPSMERTEDRVAAVKAALRQTAEADRERERQRVREKHKEQKRKRKLAQAEATGVATAPVLASTKSEGDHINSDEDERQAYRGSVRQGQALQTSIAQDEADAERVLSQLLA